jgi:hypothetical protein
MTRIVLVALLALGGLGSAFAGETVTEHETYEKRSMKVETIPPAKTTERTVDETETTRVDRPRQPAVEERTRIEPGPVVRERKSETTEQTGD